MASNIPPPGNAMAIRQGIGIAECRSFLAIYGTLFLKKLRRFITV